MDADDRTILETFVGRKLVAFRQDDYQGDSAHWMNDEPLYLSFDDGAELVLRAHGWHDSGGLEIAREESA